jgi:hypothetical protein
VGQLNEWLKDYIYIPDFRRIGTANDEKDVHRISGANIIAELHEMQHPAPGDEEKQKTFQTVQHFVRELMGEPMLKLEIPHDQKGIILNMHGHRLPLESYGTGIRQLVILCSAFAVYDGRTFLLEEPEIHLHPETDCCHRMIRPVLNFLRRGSPLTASSRSRCDCWRRRMRISGAGPGDHSAEHSSTNWPRELVRRTPAAMREAVTELKDAIERNQFVQFLFYRQMDALRAYAHSQRIGIIGDLPMFVSPESSDVWAEPGQFLLDDHGRPKVVAGVPPDYFSKTGQRWGNPLYNWKVIRRDGFRWWVSRVRASLAQADVLRIDHFRGLEAYWEIPASQPTAQKGRWVKAPGAELLETLRKELGPLPLIAEDLGDITPPVEKLRDDFSLPGMRVLQFAFGGGSDNPLLPHNHVPNAVVYTGTHDNDTAVGWFKHARLQEREHLKKYAPDAATDPGRALLRLAWSSVAKTAIAPLQDVLRFGSESRMNVPGQPTGNWTWRLKTLTQPDQMMDDLADLTRIYGRAPLSPERQSPGSQT